ncbi:MAG: Na/Pi cotransporter family protein [Flavobacteriales bacterium]|jgi:phosphate:Na+ symporter|nr:Na/Pi cotransporter family protein [Flavobacteriales bacterium]
MRFGLVEFLTLAGSLGLLIHGMKSMSEGLQKVAGGRMRQVLQAMTANRFVGVFTGFVTTVLIQLSSVTSVMAVSFVNAGVLSLRGSIGVLMGANIGTTVKAIAFSAIGFAGSTIHTFALPIVGVALPMLLMKNRQVKAIGEFLMGFAILFIGLEFLKTAIPSPDAASMEFLRGLTDHGLPSVLLFVLLGFVFTVLVQSSSVALAAAMVLCEGGIIGYEMAAATVLGMNVGTTITANIAALVGNAWARRTARAHFVIKAIGLVWALFLLAPYLHAIDAYVQRVHGASPYVDTTAVVWSLTYLHISFNVINTLLLIGFVPQLERLVTRMVPSRTAHDEQHRLKYIDDPVMGLAPELSLLEARREIAKLGRVAAAMSGMVRRLLVTKSDEERLTLMRDLERYEEITDRMEVEISRYLTRTSAEAKDEAVSERIRAMLSMIGDLERVGDIFYQMSRLLERKHAERLWFTPEQRNHLQELIDLLDRAFAVMQRNLEAADGEVAIDEAVKVEQRINHTRDRLRRGHLKSIEAGDYNVKSGLVYNDLFSSCEKVGDHVINVTEALVGEV